MFVRAFKIADFVDTERAIAPLSFISHATRLRNAFERYCDATQTYGQIAYTRSEAEQDALYLEANFQRSVMDDPDVWIY